MSRQPLFDTLYGVFSSQTVVSSVDDTPEMARLRKRLQIYDRRTNLLRFRVLARRYDSRLRPILNDRGEFHLNDCVWSDGNATCGPDTCYCFRALGDPDGYFERPAAPSRFVVPRTLFCGDSPVSTGRPMPPEETDEDDSDFYEYRVRDAENAFEWYEAHRKRRDVLHFRKVIVESGVGHKIDAVYNADGEEWHLTDCERCVDWKSGPDTCHCRMAMVDPWKYLNERYGLIDVVEIARRVKKSRPPVRYLK